MLTPTRDPLTELATRLAQFDGRAVTVIREELSAHPDQAHLTFRQALLGYELDRRGNRRSQAQDSGGRLVLIVDQFEQVFTLGGTEWMAGTGGTGGTDGGRRSFVAALHTAATHPCGPQDVPAVLVVIALRGDYWDRCGSAYPELADALEDGRFPVGPMRESDLRRAITGPAGAAGLRLEPGLTDAIMTDLRAAGSISGAAVLPLLSQAMLLTWEKREGDLLTSHGYGQIGGLSKAVTAGADDTYDSLSAGQQTIARGLFRIMTVTGPGGRAARRPALRASLYAGSLKLTGLRSTRSSRSSPPGGCSSSTRTPSRSPTTCC